MAKVSPTAISSPAQPECATVIPVAKGLCPAIIGAGIARDTRPARSLESMTGEEFEAKVLRLRAALTDADIEAQHVNEET